MRCFCHSAAGETKDGLQLGTRLKGNLFDSNLGNPPAGF